MYCVKFSEVMKLATVVVPLGIIDESQVSTAGTTTILKESLPYCNKTGVSLGFLGYFLMGIIGKLY